MSRSDELRNLPQVKPFTRWTNFYLEDTVAGDSRPTEEGLEELNSNLSRGLESCRSMIANYREMLTGEQAPAANDKEDVRGIGPSRPSALAVAAREAPKPPNNHCG